MIDGTIKLRLIVRGCSDYTLSDAAEDVDFTDTFLELTNDHEFIEEFGRIMGVDGVDYALEEYYDTHDDASVQIAEILLPHAAEIASSVCASSLTVFSPADDVELIYEMTVAEFAESPELYFFDEEVTELVEENDDVETLVSYCTGNDQYVSTKLEVI